jgi:putative (di)nucleoside polyphosphate hydrolase
MENTDTTQPNELPYRPCVGVMLINGAGLVWIGRRAGLRAESGSGFAWQMPQGGIDGDEHPRKAALRELWEETGVHSVAVIAESATWLSYDLPAELLGKSFKGRYRGQSQKWFAMRFWGDDSEISIEPRAGHTQEFDAWRWAPLAELPGLIVPFKRGIYEALVAEFAPFAKPLDESSPA